MIIVISIVVFIGVIIFLLNFASKTSSSLNIRPMTYGMGLDRMMKRDRGDLPVGPYKKPEMEQVERFNG